MIKRILLLSIYLSLFACHVISEPDGVLHGHVSIGPIMPVIREGEVEPTPNPEMYATRQIVIFDQKGRKEIVRAPINTAGDYEIALPAGTYTVDINHSGIDFVKGFPMQIEIKPYEVTYLDISIDTGIR